MLHVVEMYSRRSCGRRTLYAAQGRAGEKKEGSVREKEAE